MSKKSERRKAAQKKAKKRRIAILAVLITCVVASVVTIILVNANRPDVRVYSVAGGQAIRLYENGNFAAHLAHNVNISGTFVEREEADVTEISFTHDNGTVSTQIVDDVLILPGDWRATCRAHNHETEFPLQR
jgi:hypothetical protein